ncbi:MAG: bifunctional phosphoribosylaminoimidazolecarboxamide formyltransferase/IMP cyclohydrolase [Planctomycetota bacterium]
MPKITRALISVSDKTGVTELAKGLVALGIELVSTGGTAKTLREAGLKVKDVSEITNFPEIMDGRVKTLHPKVHGGLLFRRDVSSHVEQARQHEIQPIDMVVVNLYPFEETIIKPGLAVEDAIEQIDIGGPAMIRSAAKNWEFVTVVVDPDDYADVLIEIKENHGCTLRETRLDLAAKVFALTSRYDGAICGYLESLGEEGPPPTIALRGVLKQPLRYGENPHQKNAALYVLPGYTEPCVAQGKQVSGKEIGFNNLLDMNTAFELVNEFLQPAACVVKHNNPCGVAVAENLLAAYQLAYQGDPLSAFGGVLGFNRRLDASVAEKILSVKGFKVDAIIAPTIDPDALEMLTTKKKWGATVIIMETDISECGNHSPKILARTTAHREARVIPGGILVQNSDALETNEEFFNLKTVTRREPSAEELAAMKFAWIVCKHVKSNAIVLSQGTAVVGIGAGQMSRVDSVEISIKKAGARATGAALASDAFFPFPDGPEIAAKAGITAIIQPGGSVKDAEVIAIADRYNLAMVFTGIRHFRH